jgi:hypothetical protein
MNHDICHIYKTSYKCTGQKQMSKDFSSPEGSVYMLQLQHYQLLMSYVHN